MQFYLRHNSTFLIWLTVISTKSSSQFIHVWMTLICGFNVNCQTMLCSSRDRPIYAIKHNHLCIYRVHSAPDLPFCTFTVISAFRTLRRFATSGFYANSRYHHGLSSHHGSHMTFTTKQSQIVQIVKLLQWASICYPWRTCRCELTVHIYCELDGCGVVVGCECVYSVWCVWIAVQSS